MTARVKAAQFGALSGSAFFWVLPIFRTSPMPIYWVVSSFIGLVFYWWAVTKLVTKWHSLSANLPAATIPDYIKYFIPAFLFPLALAASIYSVHFS